MEALIEATQQELQRLQVLLGAEPGDAQAEAAAEEAAREALRRLEIVVAGEDDGSGDGAERVRALRARLAEAQRLRKGRERGREEVARRKRLLEAKATPMLTTTAAGAIGTEASKAKQLGASLERSRRLMEQELTRMGHMSGVLEEDKERLRGVQNEYGEYGSSLQESQSLLRYMRIQAMSDTMQIYLALAFFVLVVVYILWRRFRIFLYPFTWLAGKIYENLYWPTSFTSDPSAAPATDPFVPETQVLILEDPAMARPPDEL